MPSATFLLLGYSMITTIIVITLSVLYHACGSHPTIKDNSGPVNTVERTEYDIGFVNNRNNNNSTSCDCWLTLQYTVLEVIVIGVLVAVSVGSLVMLAIQLKLWILKRAEAPRERKAIKAEKMRKLILEEWASKDPVQTTIQEDPLCIGYEGKVESN